MAIIIKISTSIRVRVIIGVIAIMFHFNFIKCFIDWIISLLIQMTKDFTIINFKFIVMLYAVLDSISIVIMNYYLSELFIKHYQLIFH